MKSTWIGFIATLFSALSLLPTVYTVVKKKSTHSINYIYMSLGLFAQLLWLSYSLINEDWPLMLLAIYLIVVYCTMYVSKWYYEYTQQDVHSKLKKIIVDKI